MGMGGLDGSFGMCFRVAADGREGNTMDSCQHGWPVNLTSQMINGEMAHSAVQPDYKKHPSC